MSEKYPCSVCDRTDLSLTANGRVRSHAANGKRPGPDNPHCPGGSDFPRHDCYEEQEFKRGEGWVCKVCGHVDERPTAEQVRNAEYCISHDAPDDVFEQAEATLQLAEEKGVQPDHVLEVPAQPNPHRPPLPGGVHDNMNPPRGAFPKETSVTSADSFLGGDAPEEDTSVGNYFPARYDGDCDTCGRHFDEGDEIRRVDGGWEAKDCCGDDLDEEAEQRPQSTAPQLPVRAGRYRGPDPETGKASAWTRTTTFAEAIADSFALNQWQLRMCLLGLIKRPDLLERVRSIVQAHGPDVPLYDLAKLQREVLNGIHEDARLAAGSKDRARKGTILHKHSQEIDMGRKGVADVPDEFRRDAQAYVTAMAANGLECVPDLIERSTCVPDFEVAGTFDRVLRVVHDLEPVTLDEGRVVQLHAGEYVIGDVKTGTDLSFAWLEILIQIAIYAMGVSTSGVAVPDRGPKGSVVWRWASLAEFGIDKIRTDVGIVMHVPYGEGRAQLKYADLITGTRGAKICRQAIQYNKIKASEAAIAGYTVIEHREPEAFKPAGSQASPHAKWETAGTKRAAAAAVVKAAPTTWEEVGAVVKTRDEANEVWRKMKEKKIEPDRIARVVKIMKVALA